MIAKSKLSINWYHGDERKTDFLNRNYFDVTDFSRDRNAMGPGIYFTIYDWQARGYAGDNGYVYTVTVDLKPSRVLEDKTPVNDEKLRKFIKNCPDTEALYNYAEDKDEAYEKAFELNKDSSSNMLEALMGVYNDLYQRDAVFFAKMMTEIGYDAFYHKVNPEHEPNAIHLIVYNPKVIKVIKEEQMKKPVKEGLKHLKVFEQFVLISFPV